ncbi:DUF2635 domain-containing protein [Azospirillum soli]|uniref:DUF2635 domain-containing protein n=1 Tax=Azospirillum soli TaxID=1304799 RepID=UPI001AE5E165|nr:DUF2635 domain-containing protein [Azospirillum soli]MBP2314903.1 hypothetical protein [Azospirillum soli]
MFVKPKAGLLVRDPATGEPLPAVGREVSQDQYWMRRLQDGDVEEAMPAAPKPNVPKKGS